MKLLEVVDLNVSFFGVPVDTQAVKSASFSINNGESIGVVGASGCGKSTLLHAILRSLAPPGVITSGDIFFNGTNLCDLIESEGKKKRWNEIALVVQSALSSLNPILSIFSHFDETLEVHTDWNTEKRIEVINKALDLVQLPRHVLNSFPHQLSGGMQQRVVIALAILLEPKLIIFDEPTTALDVQVEHVLLNELKSIQKRLGFAALFVSHDLSVIRKMCDRVLVMHDGEIVDDRFTVDLEHSPVQQPRVLLAENNLPPVTHSDAKTKNTVLELKNITHTFITPSSTVVAVKNTSLAIHNGESIGIVGESGSGKSTLGRIISGLIQPTKGQVIWHSEQKSSFVGRIFHLFKSEKPAKVQMIFQNPFSALNSTQTIRESMFAPLLAQDKNSTEKERILVEMCERVGLIPAVNILDRFPHELSGGQRQRVCIARAILGKPDILIADEPTSMLDVNLRSEILGLLRQIQIQENIALVLITHDLSAAQNVCERVLICQDGQVVERGQTDKVFAAPQHPYTQSLLSLRS